MSGYGSSDFEAAEGLTLAMAQSLVCQAMREAGINQAELARRMSVTRSRITQLLQRHMTLRTFARALAACGFEVRFSLAKVNHARVARAAIRECRKAR